MKINGDYFISMVEFQTGKDFMDVLDLVRKEITKLANIVEMIIE